MASADHTTFTSARQGDVPRIKRQPDLFRVRATSGQHVPRRKFRVNQRDLSGFIVVTIALCAVAYLMGLMIGI